MTPAVPLQALRRKALPRKEQEGLLSPRWAWLPSLVPSVAMQCKLVPHSTRLSGRASGKRGDRMPLAT
jgi:hypothetical protein